MTETSNLSKTSRLPDTPGETVRQNWLDLFEVSYANRRVTGMEIEPGVHGVVIPKTCSKETDGVLLESEIRVAFGHVPGMARGVRFALDRVGDFTLTLPAEYRGWMGDRGKDVASGETQVWVFCDLAYLEAALLDRLWDHGVIVEFSSPLAFFRRGQLTDYTNIYEAAVGMVSAGRSLADTADLLAPQILSRLQNYANVYLQLSSLYLQASWQIDHDNFVIKVPGSRISLSLQYWQLRDDPGSGQKTIQDWRVRIEKVLQQALSSDCDFPRSFAA